MKTFGEILTELRQKKGLQQKELAKLLCVDATTVSHWEHGQHFPSILAAADLADIFGVSLDVLAGRKSF